MSVLQRMMAGGLSGALATAPMSVVVWGFRRLGIYQSKPPPEAITEGVLHRAGQHSAARGTSGAVMKAASHVGFGATVGALFGIGSAVLRPSPLSGAVAGLAVWKSNYDTWIPAAGVLPPPERDEQGRQATMVIAHLVYGGALGLLTSRLERMMRLDS